MKTNIDALLKEAMHAAETPDGELIRATIEKARQRKAANFAPARVNLKLGTLLIAAILIVLTATAGFAIGPVIIRSLQAGNMMVSVHEGPIPITADEAKKGIIIRSFDPPVVDDTGHTVLNSLKEAQEAFGKPLLVPSYLENGEIPCPIWKKLGDNTVVITTHYTLAPEIYSEDLTGELSFILIQEYVGDGEICIDFFGEAEWLSKITLNSGYEAMWNAGPEGSEGRGVLELIQDGIHVSIIPNNISRDYLLKIADSLIPLQ
jgi:hypothetical protein